MKSLYDSDSDGDDAANEAQARMLGTNTRRATALSDQDQAAAQKSKYNAFMKQLTKKVRRNYMDCDWFLKSNKVFFLLFLFFVLAGAMEFNSISDIPAMAMVLLLLSFYAFRREYFLAYG